MQRHIGHRHKDTTKTYKTRHGEMHAYWKYPEDPSCSGGNFE